MSNDRGRFIRCGSAPPVPHSDGAQRLGVIPGEPQARDGDPRPERTGFWIPLPGAARRRG